MPVGLISNSRQTSTFTYQTNMVPRIVFLGIANVPLRRWTPRNLGSFSAWLSLSVSDRPTGNQSDDFGVRLATPAGLNNIAKRSVIIASSPLLIVSKYDAAEIERWVVETVALCNGATWSDCVGELRRHFSWEYDNYREH
jgi:hypothetical protein